jgi:hypothetical protein
LCGTDESLEAVRLLLQHGADVDARMTCDDDDDDDAPAAPAQQEYASYPRGATALHMAAASCFEQRALAAVLLQAGALVDARAGALGWTPLMMASSYSLSLTHCLLAAGASPRAADARGECALHQVVFIAAALLRRKSAARGFAQGGADSAAAVAEAETRHGADAPVTRMLRLAAAGVPRSWRRANAAAFPPAFRATVRTLLLCAMRRAFLREADLFDAVVSRAPGGAPGRLAHFPVPRGFTRTETGAPTGGCCGAGARGARQRL